MPSLRFAAPEERRVAIITGGARGIGQATALRLAEAGRDVVIADMLEDEGAETVRETEALDQRALFIKTDVSDEIAVKAMVAKAVESFGRLDILVCCAGVLGKETPFLEQSTEEMDRIIRINLYGVYYAHQVAIPYMLERGWGRCLTITSAARFGTPFFTPYAISKGAVWSLVRSLGGHFAKDGVFVNGLEPGRTLTEMVTPRFSKEFLDHPGGPLGRYAHSEEIAEVIEYLVSERNTFATGAIWDVKGGL